ncbi:hypothetical protein XI25_05385 [Paenibacillus sp. DMB20]|nr:hypothetical protein XI25_05385 [Paenibacillus sp. DMB20]
MRSDFRESTSIYVFLINVKQTVRLAGLFAVVKARRNVYVGTYNFPPVTFTLAFGSWGLGRLADLESVQSRLEEAAAKRNRVRSNLSKWGLILEKE